jgi:hypothetical protein
MAMAQKQIPAKRSNPFAPKAAPSSMIERMHPFRKTGKADISQASAPALGKIGTSVFIHRQLIAPIVLSAARSNGFWRIWIRSGWKWFAPTLLVIFQRT